MNRVLIATIAKSSKFGKDKGFYIRDSIPSYNREDLEAEIKEKYNIELVKKEEDNFPYFTDGGFRYEAENDSFLFVIVAHWYSIAGHSRKKKLTYKEKYALQWTYNEGYIQKDAGLVHINTINSLCKKGLLKRMDVDVEEESEMRSPAWVLTNEGFNYL